MTALPVDLVLLDVDGILTDGRVSIGPNGDESKRIAFDDIDAVFRLKRAGLRIGFVSGEATPFMDYVERRFSPDFMIRGCKDKVEACDRILERTGVARDRVAFAGDSAHDAPLLRQLRFSFAPSDAPLPARAAAAVQLRARRGEGAIQEVAEYLLSGAGDVGTVALELRDAIDALAMRRLDRAFMEALARAREMIVSRPDGILVMESRNGHDAMHVEAVEQERTSGTFVVCAATNAGVKCPADICVSAAGRTPLQMVEAAFVARFLTSESGAHSAVSRRE